MKRGIDVPFLLVTCGLVIAGLLIFTSASLGLLAHSTGSAFASAAVSQILLGLVCGAVLFIFFSRIDYRKLRPYTPYFFIGAMALTILTFVPHIGLSLKGASRWIEVGSFSFQPEEILKFATIMFLAAYYAAHFKAVSTIKGGILPLICIAGSAAVVLILQPDVADVVVLGITSVVLLFSAGGRLSHLLILGLVGVAAIGIAAYEKPYVAQRIETYINGGSDPQGSGWQIQQALIAVGSGGLTGRGLGQGVEKFSYLPEATGDSIFAVAGEEFGFIGSALLVLLFGIFGILGLRIASKAPDPFGGLLASSFTVLILGQSFFNMASIVGLVPLVGIPLIFVSHGGTALALALAEAGVILSVSRYMRK